MTVCPHPKDLVPTLNWVFENQPIVSGILTENSLLADEKVPWKRGAGSYLYEIYTLDLFFCIFLTKMDHT